MSAVESKRNSDAVDLGRCDNCRKQETVKARFGICKGCHQAIYCSRECQKEDWKISHKVICNLPKANHAKLSAIFPVETIRNKVKTNKIADEKGRFLVWMKIRDLYRDISIYCNCDKTDNRRFLDLQKEYINIFDRALQGAIEYDNLAKKYNFTRLNLEEFVTKRQPQIDIERINEMVAKKLKAMNDVRVYDSY